MEVTQGTDGLQPVLAPVLQPAPFPGLVVDAAGTVTELNDAARALFGAGLGARLPDVAPEWLAEAHRSLAARSSGVPPVAAPGAGGPQGAAPVAQGPIGERVFEAHGAPLTGPDGSGGPLSGRDATIWWLVDVTEHRRLERELAAERERTALLAEASGQLLASLNLDRCMEVTARLAARHLADAAMVIAPRSGHGHPVACCGPDGRVEYRELRVDPAEVPGLAEAMRGFPPVPPRWVDPAAAPDWAARRSLGGPRAMAVTTLPGHGMPAGALVLLWKDAREGFSGGEERLTHLFAARAGAAMSMARVYAEQTSITETLMHDLLPPRTGGLDGVELAARYQPSGGGDRVGGDFYDLYPAEEEPVAGPEPAPEALVVLGDVCGKGLEAAVLTGKIRNTLRALFPLSGDHQRVLKLLNRALLNSETTRFVTLVLASIRREGGNVRLRLTSAGHTGPLIVRADGEVESVDTGGSLIGVLEDITSTTATVLLEPGDTCLLYTDGITEAAGGPLGGEMFGDERLRDELRRCGGMPPQALVERVHMLAAEWVGDNHHDDMAMIAITAPRRFHLSAVGGQGPGRYTA